MARPGRGRCSIGWGVAAAGSEGSSSIGRAPVSKTGGWGFESLLPCSPLVRAEDRRVNRQTKRLLQRQGQLGADGTPQARPPAAPTAPAPVSRTPTGPSRPARVSREYLREVRNELAKVLWPKRSEVVNYSTVVLVDARVADALLIFGLELRLRQGRAVPLQVMSDASRLRTTTTMPRRDRWR